MKKKKLLSLLVLFMMSFQVVHAYAIDMLDTHECEVDEYVVEFSQPISDHVSDDICNLHASFHIPFLLPQAILFPINTDSPESPQSFIKSYDYDAPKTFLIPPIHA